jgi:hypothetical protein
MSRFQHGTYPVNSNMNLEANSDERGACGPHSIRAHRSDNTEFQNLTTSQNSEKGRIFEWA